MRKELYSAIKNRLSSLCVNACLLYTSDAADD